jgi:hypothetical protein
MNDSGLTQAQAAAGQFLLPGEICSVKPIGSGHIHQTFLVAPISETKDKLVLQKFNTHVFRDPDAVMHNLFIVTTIYEKNRKNQG